MSLLLITSFILALIFSLIATPVMIRLSHSLNILDQPDHRKVHSTPIPRLGGVAIAFSFATSLTLVWLMFPVAFVSVIQQTNKSLLLGLGSGSALLMLLLGTWDDVRRLKPEIKFLFQFLAAVLAYAAGFQITIVSDPFSSGMINLNWLSFPLTVIWIVGLTNAFNLIDGLDGLASGTAIIALATMGVISYYYGQMNVVFISFILAGAAAGFLRYNFRPAKIFLGDSGSLFLGFVLSLLSIESLTKVSTSFAIFLPLFAFGLPIMDTTLSMIRRFLAWFLPDNSVNTDDATFSRIFYSIFQPDKSHVHHQLIQRGFSHKHTVLVMYMASALFGASAIAIALTTQADITILILLIITSVTIAGISKLKYREIAFLHNGIFLSLYNKLLIKREEFQKGLDCLFIILAFIAAYLFTDRGEGFRPDTILNSNTGLAMIFTAGCIQLCVFWFSGLYKETIRQIGIADVFQILKSILLAVFISGVVLFMVPVWQPDQIFTLIIFNFYFLTTLVLGLRIFFHLLKHLFLCSQNGPQRVIIYGAGDQGMLTLTRLLTMHSDKYRLVGFLDEDPALEGKYINGFPVFGGHWKIDRLIRTHNFKFLFIAMDDIKPEIYRRICSAAYEHDLSVRRVQVQINEIPGIKSKPKRTRKKSLPYVT